MPTSFNEKAQVVSIISANAEWKVVLEYYGRSTVQTTPFGACFQKVLAGREVVFFQGGWGKISAAAGTQYAIDRWQPELLINLGTCGGLDGKANVGDILLVEKTLVYDIEERMGDPEAALAHYSTDLDLSILHEPYPQKVVRSLLVSADKDIDPGQVEFLIRKYTAPAADWESGAIAWTASRNQVKCLILRGVSDLVAPVGGEIYDSGEFEQRAEVVMLSLLKTLPNWIRCASWGDKF